MFKTNKESIEFKSGYVLVVESWENDADYYSTRTKHFKMLEDAENYVGLVNHFQSIFGNEVHGFWRDERITFNTEGLTKEQIRYAFRFVNGAQSAYVDLFDDDGVLIGSEQDNEAIGLIESICSEFASEILGNSESYVCRVLDSWRIFEIPDDFTFHSVTSGVGKERY